MKFIPPPNEPRPPTLREVEECAVLRALAYTNGQIREAAKILGCSRWKLYRMVDEMGFKP